MFFVLELNLGTEAVILPEPSNSEPASLSPESLDFQPSPDFESTLNLPEQTILPNLTPSVNPESLSTSALGLQVWDLRLSAWVQHIEFKDQGWGFRVSGLGVATAFLCSSS